MVFNNSPLGGVDAFGQLSINLDYDQSLTQYINKGLIHGYSVARKLVNIPSNTLAFRVRRSSDNAEQDIGFIGNVVDTSSLLSFIGANDGFVVTIYDQIGSSDLTESTLLNQLRVVNSGSLEQYPSSSNICCRKSSTNDANYTGASSDITNLTAFTVCARTASSFIVTKSDPVASDVLVLRSAGTARIVIDSNTTDTATLLNENEAYLVSYRWTSSTGSLNISVNGIEDATGSSPVSLTFTFNAVGMGGAGTDGRLSDVLLFNNTLNNSDFISVNNFFIKELLLSRSIP